MKQTSSEETWLRQTLKGVQAEPSFYFCWTKKHLYFLTSTRKRLMPKKHRPLFHFRD
jgi:hypothetical protein